MITSTFIALDGGKQDSDKESDSDDSDAGSDESEAKVVPEKVLSFYVMTSYLLRILMIAVHARRQRR